MTSVKIDVRFIFSIHKTLTLRGLVMESLGGHWPSHFSAVKRTNYSKVLFLSSLSGEILALKSSVKKKKNDFLETCQLFF